MITKLTIRNFQKHKKLSLTLDKITTIVGKSDSGKSSILRSLTWVCLNKPGGSSFIRKGGKRCRVVLTVDGHKVSRIRATSENLYLLDSKTFKAFGADVPQPIADLLRITSDNIQGQHDSPYWLSLSDGQVAKVLNEVVDLTAIDKAMETLNRDHRTATAAITASRTRLQEAKEDKKKLQFVKEMDTDLQRLEQQQSRVEQTRKQLQMLKNRSVRLCEALEQVRRHKTRAAAFQSLLTRVCEAEQRLQSTRSQVSRLRDLISKHTTAENKIATAETKSKKVLAALSKIKICPTCGKPR